MPEADILVHAGDFCGMGTKGEASDFVDWFSSQDYEHKIFICGNHELFAEKMTLTELRTFLDRPGITYLHGDSTVAKGIKFWGGPWTPRFYDWAFNVDRGQLHNHWDYIPEDTQVLVTHGPPLGKRDHCRNGNVGCQELGEKIKSLKDLQLSVFGHIHPMYGTERGPLNTTPAFINASSCNEKYRLVNRPIVHEISI